MKNTFTTIKQAKDHPDIEIFDGGHFLSLGLSILGASVQIHLTPAVASAVAEALQKIVERQGEPA